MLAHRCMPSAKDWTDKKYNRLTFIRPTDRRTGGRILWEALCDCGNTTYLAPGTAASGHVKSCGCLHDEGHQKIRQFLPVISSARVVWAQAYNDGDIDFDYFYTLSQRVCDYCGSPPIREFNLATRRSKYTSELQRREGTFIYNGLDRIDSSKGHTISNVVPCCWTCNRMKGDMGYEEFKTHIKKIVAYIATSISYPSEAYR